MDLIITKKKDILVIKRKKRSKMLYALSKSTVHASNSTISDQ